MWRVKPRLVLPPRTIILPPHVSSIVIIFITNFIHFTCLAKTFAFTFPFPFCLPLPLITCLLSPFPFFRSRQFAEICPLSGNWNTSVSTSQHHMHLYRVSYYRTYHISHRLQSPNSNFRHHHLQTCHSVQWILLIPPPGWPGINSSSGGTQQMHVAAVPNAMLWHEMPGMIHLQCGANKTSLPLQVNFVATQLPKSASAICNPVASILLESVPNNLEYPGLIVSVAIVLALVSVQTIFQLRPSWN